MVKGWRKEEGVEVGEGADIAEGRALLKKKEIPENQSLMRTIKVEVARVLDVPEKAETRKEHRGVDLATLRLSDNLMYNNTL